MQISLSALPKSDGEGPLSKSSGLFGGILFPLPELTNSNRMIEDTTKQYLSVFNILQSYTGF